MGQGENQEKGGGAGPSRELRRDQELGGGAGLGKLDNLLLQLFLSSCSTDITFVTVLRTAVEAAISEVHQVASHWRGPHLLNTVVLVMDDGLFGLCESGHADELFTCRLPPPPPPPPVPNKLHGFCGR